MRVGDYLKSSVGDWTGTNRLRMTPEEPYVDTPATVSISLAGRGRFVTVTYTWVHATDGKQDGFLVIGDADAQNAIVAIWGDSWHQSPQWMDMTGRQHPGGLSVEGSYAEDARWRNHLKPGDGVLKLAMDNVVPGADYQAVEMTLTKT